jgi:branched-chain amino acid transport system permease protein
MDAVFDIYLLETLLNGLMLGGVLALLSLGLNLVFGVIDVVWICYAEFVMCGMYGVYWLNVQYGLPLVVAFLLAILIVAALGFLLHYLVIRPILETEPVNQLLVTGGVLIFLQGLATLLFGIEFRNLGLRLPILEFAEMYFSFARVLAFVVALAGLLALYLFLSRTFLGVAIRAIAQDRAIIPLMGVDARKIYLVTSMIGGALAGLAACLLVLQYDVHPAVGLTFGPITFMICVLGGLGNMVGGFIAAFIISEIIAIGGFYAELEWGYVIAFVIFIVVLVLRPQGILGKRA